MRPEMVADLCTQDPKCRYKYSKVLEFVLSEMVQLTLKWSCTVQVWDVQKTRKDADRMRTLSVFKTNKLVLLTISKF